MDWWGDDMKTNVVDNYQKSKKLLKKHKRKEKRQTIETDPVVSIISPKNARTLLIQACNTLPCFEKIRKSRSRRRLPMAISKKTNICDKIKAALLQMDDEIFT